MARYVYPVFGRLSVQAIDTGLVLKVIEPIWIAKTETANRVRGRIEAVLDWAAARGYRQSENPARWRGHLENLLPRKSRVAPVEHHPALPYAHIGTFMGELAAQKGLAARALEFVILTAARIGEAIGGLCHGNGRAAKRGVRGDQVSRCCDGVRPLRDRLGSEDPQRRSRNEMALEVEGVVNGSVHAQKALSGSG